MSGLLLHTADHQMTLGDKAVAIQIVKVVQVSGYRLLAVRYQAICKVKAGGGWCTPPIHQITRGKPDALPSDRIDSERTPKSGQRTQTACDYHTFVRK